jgi:hypothetical protein
MFRVVPNGDNRIDIEIRGQLDDGEMQALFEQLIAQAGGVDHGAMLYRIEDFELPTLAALAVEFRYLPDLLRLTTHFSRIALVCDEAWIRHFGELEGAFIPGLEIRAFAPDAMAAAEAWLDG